MNNCRTLRQLQFAAVAILILLPAGSALASDLTGVITAEYVGQREVGEWCYTLAVTWQNDPARGLSHVNLSLGEGTDCTEAEINSGVLWDDLAGVVTNASFTGEIPCMAWYEPNGDPSLNLTVPLLKFEPHPGAVRGPGPVGWGRLVFYSDKPPAQIATPNSFLSQKFGTYSSFGQVTGVFPALPCDPVASQASAWGEVKALYGAR
ncbi:MAG: hypothetical protein Q7W56_03415 [Candidatus Latescibacteria bacterium]|nr:hypothetical protein [Candidatus Latescibacterota bacterium]